MGVRKCPLCKKAPTVEPLDGYWYGQRYTWRVVDPCGRHTAYDYSQRSALYNYRRACAYSDREILAQELTAKRIAHEASITWWDRVVQRLTAWWQ